jgi:hypothetical protein
MTNDSTADHHWEVVRTLEGAPFGDGANFGQSVAVTRDGWIAAGVNNYNASQGAVAVYPPLEEAGQRFLLIADESLPPNSFFGSQLSFLSASSVHEARRTNESRGVAQDSSGFVFLAVSAPWNNQGSVAVAEINVNTYTWQFILHLKPPPLNTTTTREVSSISLVNVGAAMEGRIAAMEPSASSGSGEPPAEVNATFGSSLDWDAGGLLLHVGAWGLRGGSVITFQLRLAPNFSVATCTTIWQPFSGSASDDSSYFGASISHSLDGALLAVGAFAAFDDQGAALVMTKT